MLFPRSAHVWQDFSPFAPLSHVNFRFLLSCISSISWFKLPAFLRQSMSLPVFAVPVPFGCGLPRCAFALKLTEEFTTEPTFSARKRRARTIFSASPLRRFASSAAGFGFPTCKTVRVPDALALATVCRALDFNQLLSKRLAKSPVYSRLEVR